MIDADSRVRAALERLLPEPDATGLDWDEVTGRLGPPRRERRRVLLVAVAAAAAAAAGLLAASPIGGAVVRGVADFSAWARGDVGVPAPEAEQRAFADELRSWAGFPTTPTLRLLLEHEAGGIRYTLFGFRSGDSLCLRLVARGSGSEPATSCAPLRELKEAEAPALVLLTDHPFGARPLPAGTPAGEYVPVRGSATFGIVADGVREVEVEADDGRHSTTVGGNAFLYVAVDPAVGTRVDGASATDAHGVQHPLELVAAPFGIAGASGAQARPAQGPARVERQVRDGAIGWLDRREPRGAPLAEGPLAERAVFGRLLAPDPHSFRRMMIALVEQPPLAREARSGATELHLCWGVVAGALDTYGCGRYRDFLGGGAFRPTLSESGGDQYALVSGLAADVVERVELYLATGERLVVPLADNAFFTQAPRAKFPARLVAYDRGGRVVGVTTFPAETGARPLPGKERVVLRVQGRDAAATVRVAPSSDGGRCWRIVYSSGSEGGGCPPRSHRAPLLDAALVPAGRDVFVQVQSGDAVDLIELLPAGGKAVRLRPVEGFVVHAVPADGATLTVGVRALTADGRELARRSVGMER